VPAAALWGDPNLSVEELVAGAAHRRQHIQSGLDGLARQPR